LLQLCFGAIKLATASARQSVIYLRPRIILSRLRDRFRLTNRHARAVREHAAGDVHGLQLLEEELGGVRDVDLGDLRFVLARSALKGLVRQVPRSIG
jgi:hypothetical protein